MGFHLSEKLKVNFHPAGYLKTSLKHTSHSSTEWRICRENSGSILKISYVALHFISNGFKRDKDIKILSVNGKLLCLQDTVLINAFLTHFLNCNNTSDFFSFLNVVFFFPLKNPFWWHYFPYPLSLISININLLTRKRRQKNICSSNDYRTFEV